MFGRVKMAGKTLTERSTAAGKQTAELAKAKKNQQKWFLIEEDLSLQENIKLLAEAAQN